MKRLLCYVVAFPIVCGVMGFLLPITFYCMDAGEAAFAWFINFIAY
jgi:hypothetical protein